MATATAHPKFNLISSERIVGATVYDPSGKEIGEIDHLMIDKISGQARYAVVNFCDSCACVPATIRCHGTLSITTKNVKSTSRTSLSSYSRLPPNSAMIAGWIGTGRCVCTSTTTRAHTRRRVSQYRPITAHIGCNSNDATMNAD